MPNLIDKAIRHTPPEGHVTARADRCDGMVRITVEDTGQGFPEALLGGVFVPFAGSPDGAQTPRESAELGLAVVRTIAEARDGRAWAENLPGGGAG